ncbi:MAG TPA: hypothetical protein VMC80_02855 [Patescibacteria group bacterium]|nr:hypothetical protein [Patescibacteria group bacterium]
MPDKYLLSKRYLCPRLPEGAYPTEPNVWVAQDKVHCKHLIGAQCFHPRYRVDTCSVWNRAFEEFEKLLAQSQAKCTPTQEGDDFYEHNSAFPDGLVSTIQSQPIKTNTELTKEERARLTLEQCNIS